MTAEKRTFDRPRVTAAILEDVRQIAALGITIAAAAAPGETGLAAVRIALPVLERAIAAFRPLAAGADPTPEEQEAALDRVRREADHARRLAAQHRGRS